LLLAKFNEVGYDWDIKGIVDSIGRVYTINDDTKLISKVFELIARPILYDFAKEHGFRVYESSSQTIYPDFTLGGGVFGDKKVAVDIKSTYRRPNRNGTLRLSFTLGSYTAYLRNPTKNILFPYDQYSAHWIIGFIYTRRNVEPQRVTINDLDKIIPPIEDVEIIIRQKYEIASEIPGSGNTANIGSITSYEDLKNGTGPFAEYGEEVFEDYWRNYLNNDLARRIGLDHPPYHSLAGYFEWRRANPSTTIEVPERLLPLMGKSGSEEDEA
jgi:hypothetical protein